MNNNELKSQNTSEDFDFEMIDFGNNDELKYEDPLDWLHEHRRRVSERYPTVEALSEYLKHFDSVEEALEKVNKKIAEREQRKKELEQQKNQEEVLY